MSRALISGWVTLVVVHTALVARLVSLSDAMSRSFGMTDYVVHFVEARNALTHLVQTGAPWGWNPEWMAGFPEGHLGLVDNKLFFLILALAPEGLEVPFFNFGVLAILWVTPAVIAAAGRRAGLDAAGVLGCAVAGSITTHAVPICSAFWRGGVVSFFFASALAVWALVGLASAIDRGSLARRAGLTAIGAGTFAAFVHPGAYFVMGPGLVFTVVAVWKERGARALRDLIVIGAVTALPTLPFLLAAAPFGVQFYPPQPSSFPDGGLARLFDDWVWSLWSDQPDWGGAGAMAGMALLGASRAASASGRWASVRNALLVSLALCFVLAYAGSWMGQVQWLQPYRFLVAVAFLLCLPAGRSVAALVRARTSRSLLVAIVALVLIVRSAVLTIPPASLGSGVDETETELAALLANMTQPSDRILVQTEWRGVPPFPGSEREIWIQRFRRLPFLVPREYIGTGAFAPGMVHSYAQFSEGHLFRVPIGWFSNEERVRAALSRYAIAWVAVVAPSLERWLERFPALLEKVGTAGDATLYRVLDEQTLFAEGQGEVYAELDRIEVREARGERVVLRYHWIPTFRTIPPLRIEEVPIPGAPVGFVGVYPEGLDRFTVVSR